MGKSATRRAALMAVICAGAMTLGGCSTDNDVVKGAAIGGVGGAAVGAVVPGISPVEGAAIGAAGGAVVGAISKDKDKDKDKKQQKCADRYGYDTPAYRDCIRD